MINLIGRKIGMTRIFNNENISIPITVVSINPNRVVQIKSINIDNEIQVKNIQLTTENKKIVKLSKPQSGHFFKLGVKPGSILHEFKIKNYIKSEFKFNIGDELTINYLKKIKKIDITGISKGKGFQGSVKRWNFRTQDATHGNSLSHRALGSTGQCQTPGRVFKGKKMPGHMGNHRVTVQSLQIIKLDEKKNLLLVKGAIPGKNGGYVIIKPAIKVQHDF